MKKKTKKLNKTNISFFIFFIVIIILQTFSVTFFVLLSKYLDIIDIQQLNDDLKLVGKLKDIDFNKINKNINIVDTFNITEINIYVNKTKFILDFVCNNYIKC